MNPDWNIRFLTVAPGGIQTNFASNIKLAARHPSYNTPEGPLNQLMAYMAKPSVRDAFQRLKIALSSCLVWSIAKKNGPCHVGF